MQRCFLRVGLLMLCAGCNRAGLPSPQPGGNAEATSVTFHVTNAGTQTLYLDISGSDGIGGFDIGPNPGCGCTCGECSSCENCSPPSQWVRGLGAGESFDSVVSGKVWTWGNGCGARQCASPAASAKALTASVSYANGFTGFGAAPMTVSNGPSGEFSGTLAPPLRTANAPFDYPQASVVNLELK